MPRKSPFTPGDVVTNSRQPQLDPTVVESVWWTPAGEELMLLLSNGSVVGPYPAKHYQVLASR